MHVIVLPLFFFALFVGVLMVIGHVKRANLTRPRPEKSVAAPLPALIPAPSVAPSSVLVSSEAYEPDSSTESSSDEDPNYDRDLGCGPSPGYGGMGGP